MERIDDHVQRLVDQWKAERPDLDLEAMATVARILQLARLINSVIDKLAAAHGLQQAEGDILFTLRRSGAPYRLSPAALSAALLVSSGTLTSRLDRLEAKGMIERVPHLTDRRSVEVQLTDGARKAVDEAVTVHVHNEHQMLAPLSKPELESLNRITSKLIGHLSSGAWRVSD
jgi:DNA-binding MarR family transcriptional regulator